MSTEKSARSGRVACVDNFERFSIFKTSISGKFRILPALEI